MTHPLKAALTAALMLGAALPFAAPVSAKKPEAAATGPGMTVNAKVRAGQVAAITALSKARTLTGGGAVTPANQAAVVAALEAASPGIDAAAAAAQTNDELYVVQELRYRQQASLVAARHPGDPRAQAAAGGTIAPLLDQLLANPVTPATSIREYAFDRARLQYLANEFRPALANLQRARAAGSTEPLLNPLIVDTMIKLGDYAGATAEADKAIVALKAAGQPVPDSFYLIGIENAYRSKNGAAAVQYEQRRLADYPTTKNLHDALLRLMTRSQVTFDTRQRLDVYRLMRASKSLADQRERQNYALDALDVGASREAQAVLEEVRAGRPVTALEPDMRTALAQANTRVAAAAPLAVTEANARKATDAQSALTAANFYYSAGDFAKAAELYKLAQQRGAPDKDALLLNLGAAQAQSGDKAGAQASFQAIQSSPRKEIAGYWLVWLPQL